MGEIPTFDSIEQLLNKHAEDRGRVKAVINALEADRANVIGRLKLPGLSLSIEGFRSHLHPRPLGPSVSIEEAWARLHPKADPALATDTQEASDPPEEFWARLHPRGRFKLLFLNWYSDAKEIQDLKREYMRESEAELQRQLEVLRQAEALSDFHGEIIGWLSRAVDEISTLLTAELAGESLSEAANAVGRELEAFADQWWDFAYGGTAGDLKIKNRCTADFHEHREKVIRGLRERCYLNLGAVMSSRGVTPATTTASIVPTRRKRGPTPDYELALRFEEIVRKAAPDGNWRKRLDDVCEALDKEQIPVPKPWNQRWKYQCWTDCLESAIAIKVIHYRLKQAVQKKNSPPGTLS